MWYNIPMRVYTCRKCGKQYESAGLTDGLCEECLMDQLDKYHQVREYLWEHPGSTASDIAAACNCSVRQVMQWVKEDRFMLSDGSKVLLYCANCGRKILSGIYCPACQEAMAKEDQAKAKSDRMVQRLNHMRGVTLNRPNADEGSMRFLNKNNENNKGRKV